MDIQEIPVQADAAVDDAAAIAAMNAPLIMDMILNWIGFDQLLTRNRLRVEGLGSYEDLKHMKTLSI